MIELEKRPEDAALLASIFRTIHTIKGTCGFLGFTTLESVTHVAENLLSKLRNGEKKLTPGLVTLILAAVDASRKVLTHIEQSGTEGAEQFEDLRAQLQAECEGRVAPPGPTLPVKSAAAPEPAQPQSSTAFAPPQEEPDAGPDMKGATLKGSPVAESAIRVDVGILDNLMTLVGELVLTRNQILQAASQDDSTLQRLNLITSELQESVMRTRMQSIGVVWNKLPRVVRDLATSCGKQIALEMEGAETEIDKTIIEAIKDPLTHIVRNACDHGLEAPDVRAANGKPATGRLFLRAFHEGGYVNIEVADDGAGVDTERVKSKAVQKGLLRPEQAQHLSDREAVNLLFLPGFSTAEKVTNISGRGVGMDVVRTNIEKIGGSIELTSKARVGTTVKIRIPLTLAIVPGLIIRSGGERFVIPQVSLVELVRLEGEARRKSMDHLYGSAVFRRRGSLLPLSDLNALLGLSSDQMDPDATNIVVLQAEDRQFGLVVDGISDTQEIVVKPLGKQLKGIACYAGATIMGDGKVALILDVVGIAEMCKVLDRSRERSLTNEHAGSDATLQDTRAFLLFRAGQFSRLALPLSLVSRLEVIPASRVERAAGREVIQYRGEILPLIPLCDSLDGRREATEDEPSLQVIVVTNADRSVGLVVDEIIDIAEDRLANVTVTDRPPLLGSAVIGGHITDLVDLQSAVQPVDPGWFGERSAARESTILISDPSPFSRGMLRTNLEVAGYRVVEAGSSEEVGPRLRRMRVDAVVLGIGGFVEDAMQVLETLAAHDETSRLPVITLGDAGIDHPQIRASHGRYERDAVLQSLQMLMHAVGAAAEAGARN